MAIKLQAKQIPQNPGVYFFKKSGKILYIGKATNLRSRLKSYFNLKDIGRPSGRPMSKTLALLKEADSLSWEILGSETEALIREAELIKKYRPKYNVLMRDDKNYFYVGFTKEKYPKVFITHQPAKPKFPIFKPQFPNKSKILNSKFIGPFTEGGALRSVLKTLRRAFPYCTCKNLHKRLCLNAKIGRCLGFCCLWNSENLMSRFAGFAAFSARSPSPPAGGRRSEKAKQPEGDVSSAGGARMSKAAASDSLSDIYQKNIYAIKQILSGKNQSLARSLKKEMKKLSSEQKYEEAGRLRDKIRALARIFEHRSVVSKDMPAENNRAIKELETLLKIPEIQRIEAYDIADIHGKFAYGSMVVLASGALQKDKYRLFKIKTVFESDDPKMITEVLARRLKHPEWPYPQVIIVDGGKAQLNAANNILLKAQILQDLAQSRHGGTSRTIRQQANMRVLAKSGAEAINSKPKIIALTKNARHVGDHIFIERTKNPIPLSKLPEPLKNLILLLDSEAHRFAIKFYRKSHRKNLFS